MEFQFALILQETDSLGWILSSFELVKEDDRNFYQISEYLTPETNKKYLAPHEKKIVEILANCEESALYQRYNQDPKETATSRKLVHKKDEQKEFLFKIKERDRRLADKDKHFDNIIRPYVERNLAEAFLVAREHGVPIYNKVIGANFYPEDRISVYEGNPDVTFVFNNTPEGLERSVRVVVKNTELRLFKQSYVVLSNSPSVIKIGQTFYHFPNLEAVKLKTYFTIEKPKTSPSYLQQTFDGFVLNCVRNYKVSVKGFDVLDEYAEPKISASIIRNTKGAANIEFTFAYRSWKISNLHTARNFDVDYQWIGGKPRYTRLQRNFAFEQMFVADMEKIGLVEEDGLWRKAETTGGDDYFALLQWIQVHKKLLDTYNVEVFAESDQKVQNLQAKLEMEVVSDSIDWFDVHAVVTFGEYKIPFKKLRKNILNEDPVVQLPNNQIGIIPNEWFAKYKELFLFSTKNGNQEYFSVSTVHYKTIQRLPVTLTDALKTRLLHIETNGLKDNEFPSEIQATLRPYQVEGYRWLCFLNANNFGGCLADDMGLGKTLQTISLIQKVLNMQKEMGQHKPSLIVSPASIVYNWDNEFEKFTPNIKVFKYIGNERNREFSYFNDYDVILTTYGLLRNDIESFEKFPFYYIVLDESQMIKNPGSKIYSSVLKLNSDRKLLLTGTPIENTLIDLWTQLNFVNRDMLGSQKFFKDYFVKGIEHHDENIANQLRRIIKPFIFRREKQEVAKDLPALTEQVRYCKMSDVQSKLYETEKSKVRNMIFESIEHDTFQKTTINVLQALMRLRLLANHPQLVEGSHGSSGKFDEVLRMLPNIIHHHKVLIFSSFVRHLDLFKEHFKKEGLKFAYLIGSTSNREEVIRKFQEDEECKLFLISIKAGGVGLNLTQADYVFILDPWWNPSVENQAVSRAHRIGQKNNVTVYRFISENTIEEKIQTLQQRKTQLVSNFVPDEQTIPFSQEEISYLVE
ncbi:MAG: DEAD/DEAH box helicase [Bacteroidales bacterium]|nr:DEAD/DEAH box helicase [Bacteroidales bacterium]